MTTAKTPKKRSVIIFKLDTQAEKTLRTLSKKSLRKSIDKDSKLFRGHRLPA